MRAFLLILLLVATLPGCDSPEELRAEKLAKLDALRRETQAGLIRHQGECRAVAVEFNGDATVVGACLETHRAMISMAQKTFSDIDKRVAEINETGK